MILKPTHLEVPTYYRYYMDLILENELIEALQSSFEQTINAFGVIPNSLEAFAYDQGKWTVKQLLCHLIDTERILSYRALRFARKDQTELAGYEENDYAENDETTNRSLTSLLEEYTALRQSTLLQFKQYSTEMGERKGNANGLEVSVKAIGFMISGHELHHVKVLKERYLPEISKR
jgi:hypothetical protein